MEIKTKKKILSLCLIVALLGTLVIGASLAYFTDKEEAKNTFTIGSNVDIGMAELVTDKVNNDNSEDKTPDGLDDITGYIVGKAKDGDIKGFNYKDCLPGATYAKQPVITIGKDCNSSYVFAELEVTKTAELNKMIAYANEKDNANLPTTALNKVFLVGGLLSSDNANANASIVGAWNEGEGDLQIVYYVGKSDVIGSKATLFEGVKIPEKISQGALNELGKKASIDLNVTAYAIQSDNIDNTKAAFGELFSGQTWIGKDSEGQNSDNGTPLVSKKKNK